MKKTHDAIITPQASIDHQGAFRTIEAIINLIPHPPDQYTLDGTEELRKAYAYLKQVPGIEQTSSELSTSDALRRFLGLYPPGSWYEGYLTKSLPPLSLMSTQDEIGHFILYDCGKEGITPGGRRAYFRAIRAFFNWAYSPDSNLGLKSSDNPITARWAKKLLAKLKDDKIMPAQDARSIEAIFAHIDNLRDAAIVAVLAESGGRLGDVARIEPAGILWDDNQIKVWDEKTDNDKLMVLGPLSKDLLKAWCQEFQPEPGGNVWGIKASGIRSMLVRLTAKCGFPCNAHTFRRAFASTLRRQHINILKIASVLSHNPPMRPRRPKNDNL